MQLGAMFGNDSIGSDFAQIRDVVQAIEGAGFDSIATNDHVIGGHPDRAEGKKVHLHTTSVHEPLVLLSFIGAVTSRVELVTSILILPQRQTTLVAKQVAELDLLSGGRVRLGVGIGRNWMEYEALNEDFTNRGARQADQVELMRKLWSSDAFSYSSDFHTIDQAGINPRPSQSVPIWFGGSAPALLKRCALLGDGWMPLGGANDKSAALLDQIRVHREAAGRSMDDFGVQAQAQWAGGDPDRWTTHAKRWREIGATHLAVATHNAGETDVEGHLTRIAQYRDAISD